MLLVSSFTRAWRALTLQEEQTTSRYGRLTVNMLSVVLWAVRPVGLWVVTRTSEEPTASVFTAVK
jgi:hypothetical protein